MRCAISGSLARNKLYTAEMQSAIYLMVDYRQMTYYFVIFLVQRLDEKRSFGLQDDCIEKERGNRNPRTFCGMTAGYEVPRTAWTFFVWLCLGFGLCLPSDASFSVDFFPSWGNCWSSHTAVLMNLTKVCYYFSRQWRHIFYFFRARDLVLLHGRPLIKWHLDCADDMGTATSTGTSPCYLRDLASINDCDVTWRRSSEFCVQERPRK